MRSYRRQSSVLNRLAVDLRRLPAGIFESIHFGMEDGAPFLYPTVMAAAENSAVVH